MDVLAFTGVRAAEFCGLQIGDVGTTGRPILYIRRGAKGNERREVPLPRHSTDRLNAYLVERANRGVRSPLYRKVIGVASAGPTGGSRWVDDIVASVRGSAIQRREMLTAVVKQYDIDPDRFGEIE